MKLKLNKNGLKGKGKLKPKGRSRGRGRGFSRHLPNPIQAGRNLARGKGLRLGLGRGKKNKLSKALKRRAALAGAKVAGKGAMAGGLAFGAGTGAKSLGTMVASFFSGIFQVISGFFSAVAGFFAGIASFLSTVLLIPLIIVIAILVGIIAAIILVIVIIVVAIISLFAVDRVPEENCRDVVNSYIESVDSNGPVDVNAKELEVASQIYSFFKDLGYDYNQIVGVIANAGCESEMDPTCVETVYTEPFTIGNRKREYEQLGFKRSAILNAALRYSDASEIRSYLEQYPAIKTIGIGLFQHTNTENEGSGRATNAMKFAEANGLKWYDVKAQLGYMVADGAGDRTTFVKETYKENMAGKSAKDCFFEWRKGYEGNNSLGYEKGKEYVEKYELLENVMQYDSSFSGSVLALANTTIEEASSTTGQNLANGKCSVVNESAIGNNSDIAHAAATIAHVSEKQSEGNNGTSEYQLVHDLVCSGDTIYMSCDRVVCTAVRWAGADDDFPLGNTQTQYDYLRTSEKWEDVSESVYGSNGRIDVSKLSPGDVCITKGRGHVIVYTGSEALQSIHGNKVSADSVIVSGSFGERSAGAGKWLDSEYGGYAVFRVKAYEENSAYKNALSSYNMKNAAQSTTGGVFSVLDDLSSPTGQMVAANAIANNSTHPATYGWCAAWVGGVYNYSGIGQTRGDAYEYWTKWHHTGGAAGTPIPVGAAVIFAPSRANGGYGHIGIYVGNGMVAHNGGGVFVWTIERTASWTGGAYVGWVFPFGDRTKLGY